MRPTLDHLPHDLFGIPLFGVGWVLLIILTLLGIGILVGGGYRKAAWQAIPFASVVAAVAIFLLPNLEESYLTSAGTTDEGIPIRGYGVMLFVATVSGVWMAQYRAARRGLDADVIYSLATWVIALGLVGGRLFYVMQYWQDFQADTVLATAREMLNFAQGGLVVYGALIGASVGFMIFAIRHRAPLLFLLDMAAPGLLLGLAIGRVGCLLNGCCYGGLCDQPWAVQFPANSPAYEHQLARGSIHGFEWRLNPDQELLIVSVIDRSPAAKAGLKPQDVVVEINSMGLKDRAEPRDAGLLLSPAHQTAVNLTLKDGRQLQVGGGPLPDRSQPVHPTQIYSTLNAVLVCLLLLCAEPFLPRTGHVTALMLTVYPVTRFLLEMIRRDEMALGPMHLTISQSISVLLLLVAVGIWAHGAMRPQGILLASVHSRSRPT